MCGGLQGNTGLRSCWMGHCYWQTAYRNPRNAQGETQITVRQRLACVARNGPMSGFRARFRRNPWEADENPWRPLPAEQLVETIGEGTGDRCCPGPRTPGDLLDDETQRGSWIRPKSAGRVHTMAEEFVSEAIQPVSETIDIVRMIRSAVPSIPKCSTLITRS